MASFQSASCKGFVQFVPCVYVQKTDIYKGHFSQLVPQILYSLYIVCMYKKHTFQVSSCFQTELCTSFIQFVHFIDTCRNLMCITCTFIIVQNFDLYNLCIQNIYKFIALYNFCMHFLQFLYKSFGRSCFVDFNLSCLILRCHNF